MNQIIRKAVQYLALSAILPGIVTTTLVSATYAETYIAGQFGVTLPSVAGKSLGEGEMSGRFITPGSKVSAQSLDESILYGGKIGHYFKAVPWLGLEAEVYNTTPHIKQQMLTFSGPSGPIGSINVPGLHLRVLTVAPFNVMFRYHKARLQPYVGVGPGLFFARIEDPALTSNNTQSSMGFGVNAQAGVRYYITRQIALFGEGKFNYTRFSFDETPAGFFNLFGFDADYKMFHASFGLSVHF
jgi:hypothetical protein